MDLDQWFPNFDLFVMTILPALLLITFLIILLDFWRRRSKVRKTGRKVDWFDVLLWFSALYLIVPIYRVYQYLVGEKTWLTLVHELFTVDFENYMLVALLAGIGGAAFIFFQRAQGRSV